MSFPDYHFFYDRLMKGPKVTTHPNVQGAWQDWSADQTLHVAVAYSNPYRWNSRRRLMHDFKHHLEHTQNVKLHIGELAYGDRPFEVTTEKDVQLRSLAALFHKENILNEVVKRSFPADWKYGAYIDADFVFTRHDWALEAIHQLQHHPFVQLFSTYANMNADHEPKGLRKSFAATYVANGHQLPPNVNQSGWAGLDKPAIPYGDAVLNAVAPVPQWIPVGATGGAWSFTREAFETVGGLMDRCILGHADWFMAFGLVSQPARAMRDERYHPNYVHFIQSWQEKATALKQNIGYVEQFAVHHFHGAMKNRGYESRDQILVKYQFDPTADLRVNWQGIYELTGNKPGLRDAVHRYFLSRNEDDPTED